MPGPTTVSPARSAIAFSGVDAGNLYSLWTTDGTAAGTQEVTGVQGVSQAGLNPTEVTLYNGQLLFSGQDTSGYPFLWTTDGTAARTQEIGVPGASQYGLRPTDFTPLNGALLFSGRDVANHYNLWTTDGTAAGTQELTGVAGSSPNGLFPSGLTPYNGQLWFSGKDTSDHANLWTTDGSAAGTQEITGVAGVSRYGLRPSDFATTPSGKLLFAGQDSSNHTNLWTTDGTAAGTQEITVSGSSPDGLSPSGFTLLNGKLLFSGVDASDHSSLWTTDGTAAGTQEIGVQGGSPYGGLSPSGFTVYNGKLLFSGSDASGTSNLWTTDGTAAGTQEITGVTGSSPSGFSPSGFTPYNGNLLFSWEDTNTDINLWTTDGTAAGTQEITGVSGVGPHGLQPIGLTAFTAITPPVTEALFSDTSRSGIDRIASNSRLIGSGDPNAIVTLTADGVQLPMVTADATGAWTTPLPVLANGHHTVVASETDGAGHTGTASLGFTVVAVPAPAQVSSSDLATLLQGNGFLQFAAGTETIPLIDGTLSVGPDTNEAFVARLYQGVLGRTPDANGLAFWDATLNGSGKAVVAQDFLNGGEYQSVHAGQTDSQFVNSLYQSMLGRSADSNGFGAWTQALANGMSRGQVATGFAESPEGKQHWSGTTAGGVFAHDLNAAIVREDYHAALGREAETGGLTSWIQFLNSGGTSAQLAQDFTTSSEFRTRHGPQTNAQYVASLYQDGLGRAADPAGAAAWGNALQSGAMSRAGVLGGIAQSPEGQQHLQWALA